MISNGALGASALQAALWVCGLFVVFFFSPFFKQCVLVGRDCCGQG